jgi:hypothetical protein
MGTRSSGRVALGEVLAALGAVLLLGSMFRPWYELNFPDSLLSQARAYSGRLGELGPFLNQGIDELQRRGGIPVTAWQVLDSADIVLAVAAGAVIAAVLLNAAGALTRRLDGAIVLAGLVAAGIVTFRLISPPGTTPLLDEQLLSAQPAIYLALVGSLMMVFGGVAGSLSSTSEASPVPATTPAWAGEVKVWDAS